MLLNKRNVMFAVLGLPLAVSIGALTAYQGNAVMITIAILGLIGVLIIKKKVAYSVFLSLFVSIALIPSNYVSTLRIVTSFGDLRPSFIIMIAFLLFAPAWLLLSGKLHIIRDVKRLLFLLGIYFIVSLISIKINGGGIAQFNSSLIIFVFGFGALLFSVVCSQFITPIRTIKMCVFVSTLVAAIGVIEFFGFQMYRTLYEVDSPIFFYSIDESTTNLRRIVSSIGNPLVLSAFLLFCFPFVFYLREQAQKKIWWNISLVLHLIAILFTQSRSAFIVLALIILIFSIQKSSHFVRNAVVFSMTLSIFLLLLNSFGLLSMFTDRLLFNTESESYSLRFEAYSVSFDLLKNVGNPLFGIGQAIAEQINSTGIFSMATLDNIFLTVLVSTGLIGISLIIVILVLLSLQFSKLDKSLKPVAWSLLFTFIIVGFSFSFISYDSAWGIFWIFVGLIFMQNKTILIDLNQQNIHQKQDHWGARL